MPTEETHLSRESVATNDEEVTKAIDFLETFSEQSPPENSSNAENKTIDSTTKFSQEELLQLVREGVTYYDSLLESGSVDFYLQISSADFPFEHPEGIQRLPNGTLEGSFEFSQGRFRGDVRQNTTQYDAQGTPTFIRESELFAFDGETFETLRDLPTGPLLGRSNNPVYDSTIDPRTWGWSVTAEESLANVIDTFNIQHIESVASDTNDIYHIKGTYQNTIDIEIWLNPEKSYRPERYSFFIPTEDGIHIHGFREFKYQEVAPDLWFPKSAEGVLTATNLETGVETDVNHITVRFTNLSINKHIPSHRFNLEAQPGTTMYDNRTRESFKVE